MPYVQMTDWGGDTCQRDTCQREPHTSVCALRHDCEFVTCDTLSEGAFFVPSSLRAPSVALLLMAA